MAVAVTRMGNSEVNVVRGRGGVTRTALVLRMVCLSMRQRFAGAGEGDDRGECDHENLGECGTGHSGNLVE